MLRRLLLLAAAVSAIASASSVFVVALGFGLYALVSPRLGSAGAAALVSGAAGLLAIVLGFGLVRAARLGRLRRTAAVAAPATLTDKVVAFLRDTPVLAIAGALVAGVMTVRNPGYFGAAIRSFLDGRGNRRP